MKFSMSIAAAVVATALALPGVAGAVTYGGGGGGGSYGGGGGGSYGGGGGGSYGGGGGGSYGGGGGGSYGGGGGGSWEGHSPAPVPLPAALPLLAAGIGLMGAAASRRRRADRIA